MRCLLLGDGIIDGLLIAMHLDIYGDITYGIGMSLIFAGTAMKMGIFAYGILVWDRKMQGILLFQLVV